MPAQRKSPQPREPRRPSRGKGGGVAKGARQFVNHSLFGQIPLVPRVYPGGTYDDFDLDYRPPLPPGAVRGDPRVQAVSLFRRIPHYFYVDEVHHCVSCDRDFIFSAGEQKHWYEKLGFRLDSIAIRCLDCRRKVRGEKALRNAVERARATWAERPADARITLAVAEAIVRLREHAEYGNLNEAIALSRKAAKLGEAARIPSFEGLCRFWEAKAQALADRPHRAEPLFRDALDLLPTSKAGIALRAEALWHLDPARSGSPVS